MGARDIQETEECANLKAGDAVGLKRRNRCVAIVNNNSEKNYAERLQKLGHESHVTIESPPFHLDEKVKIKGLDGYIERCSDESYFIIIRLQCLGCAKTRISPNYIEIID